MIRSINIESLVEAAKEDLKNKNYISALFICLNLPEICAKSIYKYGSNNDSSRKLYIDWCKEYLSVCNFRHDENGYIEMYLKDSDNLKCLIGDDYQSSLYNFRCRLTHSGKFPNKVKEKSIILAVNYDSESITFDECTVVSIDALCIEILDGVDRFIYNNRRFINDLCYYIDMEDKKSIDGIEEEVKKIIEKQGS